MTDQYRSAPVTDLAGSRPLHPGAGARLRRTYLTFTLISIAAVTAIEAVVLAAAALNAGDDDSAVFLIAALVIAASAALLLMAQVRGRAALHADTVALPGARGSATFARIGAAIGWVGAVAVLGVGIVLHLRDVELALLEGFVLACAALIPAVANDGAHRMARNLTR